MTQKEFEHEMEGLARFEKEHCQTVESTRCWFETSGFGETLRQIMEWAKKEEDENSREE